MNFQLTEAQQQLIQCIRHLTPAMAERADRYDRAYEAPLEDIADLNREGLLLANLDKRLGGLGFGVDGEDPLAFVLAIEHLAMVNPSTAHCFQVHNHVVQMMSIFGSEEQRKRWLAPTVEHAALLAGVGSEPKDAPPTAGRIVPGGIRVNGVKNYATNASMGEWILIGNVAEADNPRVRLRLMINRNWPGVRVDDSIWRPMGMRACVSPTVYMEDCFVPDEDVVVQPQDPRDADWLGKFHVAFASNYIGAARGIYDWIVGYLRQRSMADAIRTLRLGELKASLDAARLLLYEAAGHFKIDTQQAMLLGCEAKWMAKNTLVQVMHSGAELAGSTAFFEKYPLERIYRDGQLHMLHNRIDVVASTVGAAELGAEYDVNRER